MATQDGRTDGDSAQPIDAAITNAMSANAGECDQGCAVSVSIMGAGLKAVITSCALPGGCAAITEADLERAARAAGVIVVCDATGLKLALAACREGRDPTGIVIARGVPPEEPVDAFLEWWAI